MITNGPRVRAFLRLLSRDIGEEEADKIINNAVTLLEKIGSPGEPSRQGLLFSQIQSGKTNNMLMSIALASDNGHRLFIILTSDNTWLYEQTFERTVSNFLVSILVLYLSANLLLYVLGSSILSIIIYLFLKFKYSLSCLTFNQGLVR